MLSPEDQADVVFFLGYPGKILVPQSTDYNGILANRLLDMSVQVENQIATQLVKIRTVRLRIESSTKRMLASQVGDIKLNENEHPLLQKEQKRLLRELGDLTGIPYCKSGGVNVGICQ